MENAQKAIMIGVGLFITIIIIAAVMAITGMGQNLLNQGQNKLANLTTQMTTQLTANYDGKTMYGSEVLVAIQNYYSDNDMFVALLPKSTSNFGDLKWVTPNYIKDVAPQISSSNSTAKIEISAGTKDITPARVSYSEFTSIGKPAYIVTTAQYISQLLVQDGAVIGIAFFRK